LFSGGEACDRYFGTDDDGAVLVFNTTGDAAGGLTLGERENSGATRKRVPQVTSYEHRNGDE
jgi:hypothetical protein